MSPRFLRRHDPIPGGGTCENFDRDARVIFLGLKILGLSFFWVDKESVQVSIPILDFIECPPPGDPISDELKRDAFHSFKKAYEIFHIKRIITNL